MDITSLLDPLALAAISPMALMITQYIKNKIPEKSVPYANIGAGLAAAFLYYYKPGVTPDFNQIVLMVVNGVIGAGGSDMVYDFFRAKPGSPQFSMSAKLPEPPKIEPEKISKETFEQLQEALKTAFESIIKPQEVKP